VFFTKAGLVIAWILFIIGAMNFAIVQFALWTDNYEYFAETFGRNFLRSSGTFVQMIALGIAFGIAAEVSRTLHVRDAADDRLDETTN